MDDLVAGDLHLVPGHVPEIPFDLVLNDDQPHGPVAVTVAAFQTFVFVFGPVCDFPGRTKY